MLSQRIRADVEAAPWVVEAVKRLEAELSAAYAEMNKHRPKAVFDRDVWERARHAQLTDSQNELRLVSVDEIDELMAEKERMAYICSVTRCDPKMDGNHVYFGLGGRPLKGDTLRHAIDNELVRMYGVAKMPHEANEGSGPGVGI